MLTLSEHLMLELNKSNQLKDLDLDDEDTFATETDTSTVTWDVSQRSSQLGTSTTSSNGTLKGSNESVASFDSAAVGQASPACHRRRRSSTLKRQKSPHKSQWTQVMDTLGESGQDSSEQDASGASSRRDTLSRGTLSRGSSYQRLSLRHLGGGKSTHEALREMGSSSFHERVGSKSRRRSNRRDSGEESNSGSFHESRESSVQDRMGSSSRHRRTGASGTNKDMSSSSFNERMGSSSHRRTNRRPSAVSSQRELSASRRDPMGSSSHRNLSRGGSRRKVGSNHSQESLQEMSSSRHRSCSSRNLSRGASYRRLGSNQSQGSLREMNTSRRNGMGSSSRCNRDRRASYRRTHSQEVLQGLGASCHSTSQRVGTAHSQDQTNWRTDDGRSSSSRRSSRLSRKQCELACALQLDKMNACNDDDAGSFHDDMDAPYQDVTGSSSRRRLSRSSTFQAQTSSKIGASSRRTLNRRVSKSFQGLSSQGGMGSSLLPSGSKQDDMGNLKLEDSMASFYADDLPAEASFPDEAEEVSDLPALSPITQRCTFQPLNSSINWNELLDSAGEDELAYLDLSTGPKRRKRPSLLRQRSLSSLMLVVEPISHFVDSTQEQVQGQMKELKNFAQGHVGEVKEKGWAHFLQARMGTFKRNMGAIGAVLKR